MSKTRSTNEEFEPLVECATCGAAVGPSNAETRWMNVQGKLEKVWLCKACVRLGKGDHVQKYIMQERKKVGRQRS